MFDIVRITEKNRDGFLSVIDNYSLAVSDILFGAVDKDTDAACGVIAGESVRDHKLGYTLAIRFLFVEERHRRQGIGSGLVSALLEMAGDVGAAAVTCCRYESYDSTDDLREFFASVEAMMTSDTVPVYGFRLCDMVISEVKHDFQCGPLAKLPDLKWREFVRMAADRGEIINVKSYYEPACSVFVYDKTRNFRGAILISRRTGVLFVDHFIVANKADSKVTELLVTLAVKQATRRYTPGTEIGITTKNNDWEMIVADYTDEKTEKIGEFVEYVIR